MARLRLLLVEDSEDDALLVLRELRRGGYEVQHTRVQTAPTMAAALGGQTFDLVISDYSMPEFDAPSALKVLQAGGHDVPFIVVSGTIGEDTAVAVMRAGAHDFILKGNLTRLLPAVERELREAENRRKRKRAEASFRALIEGSPDLITVVRDQRVVYANRAAAAGLGYGSADELVGKTLAELVHPDDLGLVVERLERVLRTGEHNPPVVVKWQKQDGSPAAVEVTSREVEFEDSAAVIAVGRDVAERERLAEQVRRSQRMESIGQLAGGVAHDFNNLLTVIGTYSELALRRLPETDPLREDLEEIKKAGEHAASLTRQLLAFSRRQVLEPKVIDVNQSLHDLDKMLQRLIGEDIDLQTHLEPNLERVLLDPGQLEQIIVNLVVNARDAMPNGGRLTLESANVDLDDTYVSRHGLSRTGRHIMLAVSDTGHGIPKDIQDRIFEPFFTTKDKGRGTGLGLSTVYGIVKQSGGDIWVYSEPGQGTTFKIFFPSTQKRTDRFPTRRRRMTPMQGFETILLVEDEAKVRGVAAKVLRESGYTVLEAGDAAQALAIANQRSGDIHLLLTDMVMPGANGSELAQSLKERVAKLKVLYTSGYTDHAIWRSGTLTPGVHFLQKPYSVDGLLTKVREVLET